MACTDCMDSQFFTDKSQEMQTEFGIPTNVSKPILKILYHSLDECGLNCCDNEVSVDNVMIYQSEGTNVDPTGIATALNFVGDGVTAVLSGNTIVITINDVPPGSIPVADGNYGAIEVTNNGLTWTIPADVVELESLTQIPKLTVLGNPYNVTSSVQAIRLDAGFTTDVTNPALTKISTDIAGQNLGSGTAIFSTSDGATLSFKTLVAGGNINISSTSNSVTITNTGGSGSGTPTTIYYDPLSRQIALNPGGSNTTIVLPLVSALQDGLVPQGNNDATYFLNGTGTWSIPASSGGFGWGLSGNAITAGQWLGTSNPQDLVFKRDSNPSGVISDNLTSFGYFSSSNTTPIGNTAIGRFTLYSNSTGSGNTAVGHQGLQFNNTGIHNTAVGANVLEQNTTGNNNTAIGTGALYNNTVGSYNVANGYASLRSNVGGSSNIAIGHNSLYANISGNNNTAVGATSLISTEGSENTGIGTDTLSSNTVGNYNTAIGARANVINNNQLYSTAIGSNAKVSTNNTVKLGRSVEDSVVIGQDGKVDSAKLAVTSTTQGLLFPRMTTAQKTAIASPVAGLVVYDTDLNKLCVYTTGWETITSV